MGSKQFAKRAQQFTRRGGTAGMASASPEVFGRHRGKLLLAAGLVEDQTHVDHNTQL
jgi:hypothetical protein